MKITWSAAGQASARRFMADQAGMQAVNAAVAALADDPEPPAAFIHGEYRRLRVDSYRVMYVVEGDRITVLRVDRISSGFLLSCWGI